MAAAQQLQWLVCKWLGQSIVLAERFSAQQHTRQGSNMQASPHPRLTSMHPAAHHLNTPHLRGHGGVLVQHAHTKLGVEQAGVTRVGQQVGAKLGASRQRIPAGWWQCSV